MILQIIKFIKPESPRTKPKFNQSNILSLRITNKIVTTIENTTPFFEFPISQDKVINTTRAKAIMTMISTATLLGGIYQMIELKPSQPIRIIIRDIIGRLRFFMDTLIILSVILVGFGLVIYFLLQNKPKEDPTLAKWLSSTQLSLNNSSRLMADLQRSLGEMSEVGRGIKTLQDFLASPKLRGGLGEEILSQMIGQTFPKNAFHLQYSFKSGVKVDAVLKTDAGLLCIDSKFPMNGFEVADIKKHISDIARKYILPEEGTMDFALMYIPSESVYYEVVSNRELTKYSRDNRVYPVSPNTLYAHLQVLLQSLQGKELESKSKKIFALLRAVQKDYEKIGDAIGTLNRHVTNSYNQMSQVSSSYGLMGQKLGQTKQLEESD